MATSTNTQFAVAVHVLSYLAGVPETIPVTSEELSETTGSSPVYIRQVLGQLRKSGLVTARRGAHGGWALAAPADEIPLSVVWEVVQGDVHPFGMHGPNPTCQVGSSVQSSLGVVDTAVTASIRATLSGYTVSDMRRPS